MKMIQHAFILLIIFLMILDIKGLDDRQRHHHQLSESWYQREISRRLEVDRTQIHQLASEISVAATTESPSTAPTEAPTKYQPTSMPSSQKDWSTAPISTLPPTKEYSYSQSPTVNIEMTPSVAPSRFVSTSPTISPSRESPPTSSPVMSDSIPSTYSPTMAPTASPTISPSIPSFFIAVDTAFPTSATPTMAPTEQPIIPPSCSPSAVPTESPSASPSVYPTLHPTVSPTLIPSSAPSTEPTIIPTASPSVQHSTIVPTQPPTESPTGAPTANPSPIPTETPSTSPTSEPSHVPTNSPTALPTVHPTASPTTCPSEVPSAFPTEIPTHFPTAAPSVPPTIFPTETSTEAPSMLPSELPSVLPSVVPSENPTFVITMTPTQHPSETPSSEPTATPSDIPSEQPTFLPTVSPSFAPTASPSSAPSVAPSIQPSTAPTAVPTTYPSYYPTIGPSELPTVSSSEIPTVFRSDVPTVSPSAAPTTSPTSSPTTAPTMNPTTSPTTAPTCSPSASPTTIPSTHPTNIEAHALPTVEPSERPTVQPTLNPSTFPTARPTQMPTISPTESPTIAPTEKPTSSPTISPTTCPTYFPSELPTVLPSTVPTPDPTLFPSMQPSSEPTEFPSPDPSNPPTVLPMTTVGPSVAPTDEPSAVPTPVPSIQPTTHPSLDPSVAPTVSPSTDSPSTIPSTSPSEVPTIMPTFPPSVSPTATPSNPPTESPSGAPTTSPTYSPTEFPTVSLSQSPSSDPTWNPSGVPSIHPSINPSVEPSETPTMSPSIFPTEHPSEVPSINPSAFPSIAPSTTPSSAPTAPLTTNPTVAPTSEPSAVPSANPTIGPTVAPSSSFVPTDVPTLAPTSLPTLSPTIAPTSISTENPTVAPSIVMTNEPSVVPSDAPTLFPVVVIKSIAPTEFPTDEPSISPSGAPSVNPTVLPSESPTVSPTMVPTLLPSKHPTPYPTEVPTHAPTVEVKVTSSPTEEITTYPTLTPSMAPSLSPTASPTLGSTLSPSVSPTIVSTLIPSANPSTNPTMVPSFSPSVQVTVAPTINPTRVPTNTLSPTLIPTTSVPSLLPSVNPTVAPTTPLPTVQPTKQPISQPSGQPSRQPTGQPTRQPTRQPTSQPSRQPSRQPTGQPTRQPTGQPTRQPSSQPTFQPSNQPTGQPSGQPSFQPSGQPTCQPNSLPTSQPTSEPSGFPTSLPTGVPSSIPSMVPTAIPSGLPTAMPTAYPSTSPSCRPSGSPTTHPSRVPSSSPSVPPTSIPTSRPTSRPTSLPSLVPTSRPSPKPSPAPSVIPTVSPTTAPSRYASILPVIASITASPGISNATVSVHFSSTGTPSGNIFCVATTTVIQSTSTVTGSGYFASYTSETKSVAVVIKGLVAAKNYTVYCVARNIDGSISSLPQVLQLGQKFMTQCCRSISISSSPSYLLNNPTLYWSNKVSATNVFKYSLGSPPDNLITIKPYLVYFNGSRVASAFWSSSPSIMMIYSNNATSDCSFSLVVFSSVASGSYRLLMDLTTPGAIRQYSTPSLTVKVVDVSSTASILLPPPSLSSVVFSDNGALVYISFESATNRASISDSQWTCSRVFSFLGDSQATCTWINSTVVEASLNREASSTSSNRRLAGTSTLAVGGSITVLPGKIAAECPSTSFFYVNCSAFMYLTTAIPITASTPSNPVKPTPIIVVPSKIQRCTDFTIDPSLSYGNGGQSFVAVIWTVKREGITVSSLQNALNNLGFAPLNVPSTFGLTDGTYYVTLSLTNIFGEKQEATISFYYGAALYSPTIEILGSKSREIKFGDSLMIYSKVSVPVSSCSGVNSANLTQLVISWKIFKREVDIITGSTHLQPTTVTSISNNPRTFHLAGYGFPGEGDYVVKIIASATTTDKWSLVNATSSVEVAVYGGDVIAAISGGATRSIVADTELDASGSYDQRNNVTELSFKWTCSILSGALYGSSCDEIFENMLGSTLSKAKVMLSKLLNGISYQVYVTVTASDGRVGGTSITVVKGDSSYGEYILEIANTATEFNGEDNLAIYGYVGAVNNFTAVWTASTPTSNNIALSNTYTATALVRNFTLPSYSGYTKIPFPISVAPFVLSSYSKVTFRLSLYGIGTYEDSESSPFAYSEITLKVNSAPYGGTVLISPGSGSAFKTQFNIETAGWVDGDADQSLPLTFDYRYRRVSTSSWLTIQQRSTQMHASSLLPSGTSEDGYRLTVIVRAFDSLLASSNVTSTAIVSSTAGFDYLGYLNSQESSSSDDQADVNQQYVIANNVLTMFNGVDCSMAPPSQCALMNRYNCSLVSNMCGDCLDGYYGDAGAANTPCFKYNATAKSTGASCKSDDECQYGKCLNHTCSLPLKTCPADCSGRGHCIYAVNGASVESKDCAVSNPYCVAKCSCDEGYGGFACEFTSEEAFARSSIISVVCATLQQVLLNSDPSPQFLESMTSSIFLSSSSSATAGDADTPVITSIDDSCIALFESLSEIVKEGYLNGTSHVEDTSLQLISSLSNFASAIEVQYSTLSEIVNIDKSLLALSSLLEDILANLIQGMFTAMVTGESNKEYVTDNLMMSLYRDYIDPMKTTVSLKPPQSSQEIAFEKVSPSISFVGDSFRYCDAGNGYVKTSVVKWVSSPFPNTTNIDSPLFRSEAYVDPANNNFPTVDVNKPVFYIILPFTTTQNIMNNDSISGSIADIISTSNYTITQPKCFTYNSSLVSGSEYFMCNNCNISSYTNETVTFECYDISMICGVSATDSTANKRYRNLLSLTGDDDGFGSTGSQPKSQQIAAILSSVVVEIETVISTNPFSINYEKSKVVVSFVGALCLVIIFGMLFFNNWDWRDHHKLVYAHGSGDFFGKPAVAQSGSKHGFEDDEGEVEYDVVEENGMKNNDEEVVRKSKMDGSQHSAEKNSNNNFGYKKSKSIKRSRETKLLQDALLNAERFDGNDEDDDDESNSDEPAPHTNDGFASKIPNPMDGNEMEVIKNFLDLAIPLRMNKLDEKSKKNRVKSIDLNANYRSSVGSVSLASSNISYSQKSTSFWLSMSAFWKTYWKTVWNHHLLTRMLGEASLSHTRLIRWVHLVMMILLMLFVDTLFFGIFFPDEGFCESQQTKADCLSSVSSVTNDYLCVWEESVSWGSLNTYNYAPTQTAQASVSCSIASPPNTLSFIFILAVCTIIVALPLTVFYEYILMEICSKRPDLSLYGFYTARYFGSELTDVQEHRVDISEFEKMFFGNHGYDNADFFDLTEEEFFARVEEVTRSYFDSPQGYTLQEQDYITRMIYANCMTTEAETDLLLREVRHYIIRHVFRAQVPWSYVASLNSTAKSAQTPRQSHDSAENEFPRASSPNRVSFAQSTVDKNSPSVSRTPSQSIPPPVWKTSASTEEKLKVMQELLGMYVDTTPRPMTMLDRIWYGDRRKRLELKIQSARRKALSIESKLWSIPDLSGFERSICLIRYFLLEMFSPFKQFVIKFQYFPFQSFSKETISLKLWLFGWVVILGSMVFFLYWILAWGVSSGSTTFANWGWNFLLVVIQEIIFIQLAHIYVIYFVAMFSIEPQLISIYHCLHNIAIDIVNNTKERVEKEEQQMRLMMQQQQELLAQQEQQILLFQQQGMHDPGSTSPVSEVPVIVNPQQFSPGVTRGRASPLVITNNSPVSPSKSTSSTSFPTSPQVTNQSANLSLAAARAAQAFEDTSVVQYLSPACRVANRSVMKDLPAAKILRHFLDSDLIICKQSSNKQLYLITFLFIGIPVIFSTVISEQFGIMVLDAILPSGLYLYIVANYYLYEVSVYLLIAVYILIVFIYFYRQWVYKPAIERWERQRFARRHATDLPDAVDSDSKISEYDSDRLKHQNSVLSLRRCFNRTSSSNEKRNTSCVSKVIFVVCATFALTWALLRFIWTSFQYCIVIAPYEWYRFMFWSKSDLRYDSRSRAIQFWRRMNIPTILQGMEVSLEDYGHYREQLLSASTGMVIPPQIQELRVQVKNPMTSGEGQPPTKSAAATNGWSTHYEEGYNDVLSRILSLELLSNPQRENPLENLMWLREASSANMLQNGDNKGQVRQATIIAPTMELHDIVVDLKISSIDKNMSLNDGALLIDDTAGSKRVSARFSHRVGNEVPAPPAEEPQPEDYSYTDVPRQAWNFMVYSRFGLDIPTELTVTEAKEILIELLRIYRPCHLPIDEEDQEKVIHRFERRLPKDEHISPDMMTLNTERFELWFLGQAKSLRNKMASENDVGVSSGGGGNVGLPPLVI